MRLLIAGGGTGGHIYPALAVARSLRDRDRPTAPDLVWLGGRRGLEAELVPRPDPASGACAALAPDRRRSSPHGARPGPARRCPCRRPRRSSRAERPAAILTTGGYVAVPVLLAAAPLRIPVVLWEGNAVPGRAVRATARLADALAVSYEAAGGRSPPAARPTYVTGTPIRDVAAISRAAARERLDLPPDAPTILIFGGSQAVRRFNAAVADALPRLVERVHVAPRHAARAATPPRSPSASGCRPSCASRYRPFPFLREDMLAALVATDLVVGRAGSSTVAEVTRSGSRRSSSRTRTRPATRAPTRRSSPPRAPRGSSPTRRSTPTRSWRRRTSCFDERGPIRDGGAARGFGRPGAADAVAALDPRARRAASRCQRSSGSRRSRGARPRDGVRRGRPPSAAVRPARRRDRDPAPDRGEDVARRAARAVHDDAGRRAGRPVRDRPQHPRAPGDRPLRPVARRSR